MLPVPLVKLTPAEIQMLLQSFGADKKAVVIPNKRAAIIPQIEHIHPPNSCRKQLHHHKQEEKDE